MALELLPPCALTGVVLAEGILDGLFARRAALAKRGLLLVLSLFGGSSQKVGGAGDVLFAFALGLRSCHDGSRTGNDPVTSGQVVTDQPALFLAELTAPAAKCASNQPRYPWRHDGRVIGPTYFQAARSRLRAGEAAAGSRATPFPRSDSGGVH